MKTKVQVTCSSNDQAFRRICGGAKALMGKARTPGAALGIYHNGREHYAGLGVTSMDNPLPVTPDTLFQIGSISKTFLVTIVLMLAEKGKLNINLPVRRYLPKLKLNDNSVARRVTLRDLFTHSGGWDGDFFKDFGRGEDAVRRITEDLSGLRQVAPLGKFWSYNNSGFYIAGRVVEVVTGKPYEKVVQEMLFDPLGMKNSFFFAEDVLTRRFAVGHEMVQKKLEVARAWDLGRSIYPAGGILCSARDLMCYARFHLDGCRLPSGKRLLSEKTVTEFHTEIMPATGIKGIALSWFVTRPGGAYLISHGGTTNGQVAELYICREKNYAALGFANGEFGRMVLGPALENALRHYCGVQHPVPKPGKQPASIKEYLGTYLTHFMSYTLFTDRKGLQLSYKYGNPEYQKKYGSGDLMRMGFYGKDKVMLLGAKYRGNYGEFLRDDKGRVRWLRLFLRVHPKKK